MQIPKPVTVNTGDQEEVYENIERFLLKAKSEIEKKVGKEYGPSKFRIENKGLCRLIGEEFLQGNEFAHMLYYKDNVVAVVLETRTEMNYVHFDFFFNSKLL